MCGRATLTVSPEELEETFGLSEKPSLVARYNLAPSQELATLKHGKNRRVEPLKWGLRLPKDPKPHVNTRSEIVANAPMYRESFAQRRCVVLVDGFYEWSHDGDTKMPFWIHRTDGKPFAIAGIYNDGTCSVLTTKAKGIVARLHDRMPVIVSVNLLDMYLDGTRDEARALCAANDSGLELQAVSTLVNSPKNDGPELLRPPTEPKQRKLF
jgi:putative SOS response-associated peptidase YedK